MKIAIASGKGGTGKTTVATCLAQVLAETGLRVRYLDCDVEEPNGHLFLHPEIYESKPVTVPVPEVDREKCVGCGLCAKICQYAAIACVKKKVVTFPELCHGCGGCARVCPAGAIREVGRGIGVAETGRSCKIDFAQGCLRVGEAMSPSLIRQVRDIPTGAELDIIDAPPGTSCPAITAIRGADFVLLVTEPTPFGLNDLALALDMVRELDIPRAVVVNRHEDENLSARKFCSERHVQIAAEIPDDRRVAEAYSQGLLPVIALPEYRPYFLDLWANVNKLATGTPGKEPA
jgi:MinD superfamily P-loop ATPase